MPNDKSYSQSEVDEIIRSRLADVANTQFTERIAAELKIVGNRIDESNHWKKEVVGTVQEIQRQQATSADTQRVMSDQMTAMQGTITSLHRKVEPLILAIEQSGTDSASLLPAMLNAARKADEISKVSSKKYERRLALVGAGVGVIVAVGTMLLWFTAIGWRP